MRIGLVANWGERCGVAEYAQSLAEHVEGSGVHIKPVGPPLLFDHIYAETEDVDVIHFNYASGIFRHIKLEEWPKFKRPGQKVLMTFHDSSQDMIQRVAKAPLFDRMVVHEKAGWIKYPETVQVIPQPVRMAYLPNVEVEQKVGTAGFPFPWKGLLRVALATKRLELGYLALLSKSDQVDAEKEKKEILWRNPKAEVITDWLEYGDIVRRLSACLMTIFDYDFSYVGHSLYGISAAVRMGIAARRPVLVSDCRQFQDLKEYEDEIYFIRNGLDDTIRQVLEDIKAGKARRPTRILLDMNWTTCAYKYVELYKELVSDPVSHNA